MSRNTLNLKSLHLEFRHETYPLCLINLDAEISEIHLLVLHVE